MKTELTEVKSYLPVFPGFYGTLYEPDETNEIEDINSERRSKDMPEITYDDCNFEYKTYQNEIAQKACSFIQDELKTFITEIKYECVYSPKWYNFENDSINCTYILSEENLKAIKKYLNDNEESFSGYLKDRYTSCSGFISFHSNKLSEWLENIDECLSDKHRLGGILNFIASNENEDIEDEMYNYCSEGVMIFASNYYELIGESNESLKGLP